MASLTSAPRRIVFAYPGDLDTPTGGYGYDRRIIAGLRALGWTVDLLGLGEGFPFPDPSTVETARRALEALAPGTTVVVDGLAFGVLPQAVAAVRDRLDLVALVHHPLCKESGLCPDVAGPMEASEKAALEHAAQVIVTSPATAEQVGTLFGISGKQLAIVLPGTDPAPAGHEEKRGTLRLLSVGTVVPRKGYDLLFDALAGLSGHDWHLDIVGDCGRDEVCFGQLQGQLDRLGLAGRVTFHGAVTADRLSDYYQAADIFALASRYEGYGMAYTEALAHGLPVIGSGAGAVRETLSQGGAIYCGVEDIAALQEALEGLLGDPGARRSLSSAARQASRELPTWDDASRMFSDCLEGI
jgi:glycosyltransferase involved in cell wall biosynthesis